MKNTKFDSLILDVDGTLWDSTGVVADAWMKAVYDYDGARVEITADMLKNLFGKVMTEIAANLFPQYTEEQREEILKLCCEYEHRFLVENEKDICYPGVVDTIKKLSQNIPVFIVSNCQSGYIELFLEKTGLEAYVKDTECFGDTGKMKGDNILLLMERNNLKNPAYVGDIKGDFEAAEFAGIPFIHVAYGFGDVENPYGRISKFSELEKFV